MGSSVLMGVAHVTTLKDGSLVFSACASGSSGLWLVSVGAAGAGMVMVWSVLALPGAGLAALLVRILVSCLRAWTWLSVSGANGDPGNGLFRAATMSLMPARIRSLDNVSGIMNLVGNQDTVLQMCSKRVSHTQIV